MQITGLHHITLVCSDAQQTLDFYTRVLGLRFIKKTINFDDPGAYHLYFGDEAGSPGSAVTFFEWPRAPQGRPGVGGTHHFALGVSDYDGLLRWKRRLRDRGLAVDGPHDRNYFQSIYFNDPDGTIVEIATLGPGFAVDEAQDALGSQEQRPPEQMLVSHRKTEEIEDETWPDPVPEITSAMALRHGLHHVTAISSNIERTNEFYRDLLGLELIKRTINFDDPESAHWYWGRKRSGDKGGEPCTMVTYFERDPHKEQYRHVQMGAGQTHHFAFSVPDEETQLAFRDQIASAGYRVSPIMDRVYFRSIYTNDPDGHIVEIATAEPGFLVDEEMDELGQGLKLPEWLEARRPLIEENLKPLDAPAWQSPQPV